MSWLKRLRRDGRPEAGERESPFQLLLADHGLAAYERQLAFAELTGERDWHLEQDTGIL